MIEEKRNELVRILNKGFEFELTEQVFKRKSGLLGLFLKNEKQFIKHTFLIKEPTLSVLDRISLISLSLNETEFNDLVSDNDKKKYSRKHYKTMAMIIAIIVAGPDASECEINKKSILFFKYLKPSDIFNIIQLSDITNNLGDFINSTRYVAAANVLNEPKADPVEETTV